jgi:hypothetical protein
MSKQKGWKYSVYYFLFLFIINELAAKKATIYNFLNIFFSKNKIEPTINILKEYPLGKMYMIKSFNLILLLILTYFFTIYINKENFLDLGLRGKHFLKKITLGFFVGFFLITNLFVFYWIGNYINVSKFSIDTREFIFSFLFWMMIGIIEELSFRGYLLNNLMQSVNKYISVIIISLIFALLHIGNPNVKFLGIVNLVLFGIFMGLYYIEKKDLWFPIFMHFSWNFFEGTFYGFSVSGMNKFPTFFNIKTISKNKLILGGDFGPESSILVFVLLIISIIIMEIIFIKNKKN